MRLTDFVAAAAITVSTITPAFAQVSSVIAVPEPATLTIMAGGTVALLLLRHKKKK